MQNINYSAGLPTLPIIGASAINLDTWISGLKGNFDSIMKRLFANNEQGFAYDPNDLSTLFQDAAGTIPVTGAGQPVGLIKDKSGRNNHAFQTVSASRPLLQRNATTGAYYLAFDGIDDFLVTNNIDFTATDKVTVICAYKFESTSGTAVPYEFGASVSNIGTFGAMLTNNTTQAPYRGSTTTVWMAGGSTLQAPRSSVQTSKYNLAGGSSIKLNSAAYATDISTGGGGVFGSYPLYIGRRRGTTLPFNGHIYSLICISRLTTDSETIALEKAIAKLTGVTLNV